MTGFGGFGGVGGIGAGRRGGGLPYVFTAPAGASEWVAPAIGTYIVFAVGAGGGSRVATSSPANGGSGGFCRLNKEFRKGDKLTISVGSGGGSGSSAGSAGGATTVIGSGVSLNAGGGGGGTSSNGGGAGGIATGGDTNINGLQSGFAGPPEPPDGITPFSQDPSLYGKVVGAGGRTSTSVSAENWTIGSTGAVVIVGAI